MGAAGENFLVLDVAESKENVLVRNWGEIQGYFEKTLRNSNFPHFSRFCQGFFSIKVFKVFKVVKAVLPTLYNSKTAWNFYIPKKALIA